MKPSRSLRRPLLLIVLMALVQVAEVSAQVERTADASFATVRAVRFHVEPGQTRVWLETSGAVLYTHYSPDPLTLVIDLPGVDVSALPPRTVVGSREVESILATSLDGVNGKRLSRIEIKLATITPYQLSGSEQALERRLRRKRHPRAHGVQFSRELGLCERDRAGRRSVPGAGSNR